MRATDHFLVRFLRTHVIAGTCCNRAVHAQGSHHPHRVKISWTRLDPGDGLDSAVGSGFDEGFVVAPVLVGVSRLAAISAPTAPPWNASTWSPNPATATTIPRVLALFAYHTRVRATPDASAVIGPAG